jgi:site-specific recombinase XerD|nr:MAG TPA: SITE SPECIFIC RECOMBINASE XERD [Caudoviricetes sp.]
MRDKLLNEIMLILMNAGFDTEEVKSRLVILLNDFDITSRCTEVAVVDEDEIEHYVKLFLVNKRVAGLTPRSLQQYKSELGRFFREINKSPLLVTPDDIKLYLATKEIRDGASKVYQKNILRVISSFYNWMQKEEHLLRNPVNKVERIKQPKVRKEAFTEAQIEQMRFVIEDDIRLMCIFEMLVSTWCRVSELASIKISEISEDMGHVLIHGKGNKERICYINARAKICLQRYLAERKDTNEYLFPKCKITVNDKEHVFSSECKKEKKNPKDWWMAADLVGEGHVDKSSIEGMIRKIGKKAGVEKAHPHRFRRTGATFALRRGMPIEQVSKLLGHESIETTQIYLDISDQELENAHKKYV